jgi:DNA (cytosine-5)-methyltransferase 1
MEQLRTSVIQLGENRGAPRVYLQGGWLVKAGFKANSRFRATFGKGSVTLELDEQGDRKVSGKKQDTVPVVDINTQELAKSLTSKRLEVKAFLNKIVITATCIALLVASRSFAATEGSLFSGGGFLSQAAREAGFTPRFAVEINEQYADIFERNHPEAVMFNCSAEEVAYDTLRQFRPLGLLTMGIPCEPYSNIRRLDRGGQTKRDQSLPPEAHEAGDLTFWAARAVEATNPYTVIVENVPGYLNSASGFILQAVLRRLGYNVDARIVDPVEYGELTGRKRAVIVAHSGPIQWPEPSHTVRRLGDILDPEPHDWFNRETKSWVFNHWDAQTAKGNGFAAQQVTAESHSVGTIKKRYLAMQGDNPVVMHPTRPETARWFTLNELKKLHGIPEQYDLSGAKTLAGEVIGQGVVVSVFQRIIEAVTGVKRDAVAA